MSHFGLGRDDAALIVPAFAAAEYSLTAGAGTDNVEKTAAALDLRDQFDTTRFGSAIAMVTAAATLAAGATLTVSAIWEHSADGVTYAEIGTDRVILTLTGPTGGGTVTGAGKLGCNLLEAERFVRVKYTPDLSAAGADTAKIGVGYVLSSPTQIG